MKNCPILPLKLKKVPAMASEGKEAESRGCNAAVEHVAKSATLQVSLVWGHKNSRVQCPFMPSPQGSLQSRTGTGEEKVLTLDLMMILLHGIVAVLTMPTVS